ncbi:MAG: hypothetical protein RLZ71_1137 [Actinomycetota bacterium]|jgi:hypothetical protein
MFRNVKPKPAALSPLLKSDTQGMILAQLFMNPTDGFSISELGRFARTSTPTAMREIDRLLESHLVTEKTYGRARVIQANQKHRLYKAIKEIVAYSYGPTAVLPVALYRIDGLEKAFLYGPYAAHLKRELGPEPHDVDLLLIGYMNRIDASKAAERVEGYLGRAVNVQFIGSQEWQKGESNFVKEVQSRPLVELDLDL